MHDADPQDRDVSTDTKFYWLKVRFTMKSCLLDFESARGDVARTCYAVLKCTFVYIIEK